MSKRVEVREGDQWFLCSGGVYQVRGKEERHVCGSASLALSHWNTAGMESGESLPPHVARAWIESLGGEWAEVAEEKKQEAVPVVAYANNEGHVVLAIAGSLQAKANDEERRFRRITIAGVTT